MRAGELRHRITINSKSVEQNSFGEEDITWVEFATVWAAVEPASGREFLEGSQITAEITTLISIRKMDGIIPEMQVVFGSKVYDVLSVIHVEERNREIQMLCQEII